MANWNAIEELKQIFINEYTNTDLSNKLEKACSDEYELKRDYNGRQILELLQNVDDVYNELNKTKKSKNASVKITYKNNLLEVGNTGPTFTSETIERLCLGGASGKSSNDIGNKGTGFRSLLNDAEWIEIHSGDFNIKFSETYTQSIFDTYKSNDLIKKQCEQWKKDYSLCFPVMNFPEEIDKVETAFDTLIRVKLKEDNNSKETSITNQLQQPFYKALLFLPNINKIVVETDEGIKTYEKICDNNIILLQDSDNDFLYEYYVEKKEITLSNKKEANIIIAVPLNKDYDFSNETLYCYFPIRNFPTPVHALIHAPFQTNHSRDDIPNDDEQLNQELLKDTLIFLKEIAEKIALDKIGYIDLPITTLAPIDNFYGKIWNSSYFNLKNFYIELLKDANLLPTVNQELISISNKPKYIEQDFPIEFKGKLFNNLLIRLEDDVIQFIFDLANYCDYSKHDFLYSSYSNLNILKNNISALSNNFDVPTSVNIFLWWCKYSKQNCGIPNLLKDTMGNWIQENTKVYLPTDNGISILPKDLSWVNLCILEHKYVNELIEQIQNNNQDEWNNIKKKVDEKTANKRILDKYSDEFFPVKFTEQSSLELVIGEINKQIDTNEKSITFLNWFFDNYKNIFKERESSTLYDMSYNFIDRDNNIVESKMLYFGKEYNQSLSEKLFTNIGYSAVAPLSTIFRGEEENKESFIQFLHKCGVLYYPKIHERNFSFRDIDHQFATFLQTKYNYQNNINYIKVKTIDNLTTILNNLTTSEIIQWFKEDTELQNLMQFNEKTGFFSQKSNSSYPIDCNEYVKYILNNTSWICLNGNKYKPNQIVKYSKLENKINEIYGISERDLIYKLSRNVVLDYKLDFKNSISDFPDIIIKKLLDELPYVDKNGEISRKLYEDIIINKKGISPTYLVSNLKLFGLDGQFHSNKDLKYAPRKIHRNINNKSFLIDIQPKKNIEETIKNWFGVEKYKSDLILKNYEKIDNIESFENETKEIKIATLASMNNETITYIDRLKKLTIIPCSYISVIDAENNSNQIDLEDYNYIINNDQYLMKLPNQYDNTLLEKSVDFSNSIIEIIEDYVSPQIDKNLIGRLISSSIENKKIIIEDQFGVDKWNYSKELLFQQTLINDKINKFFTDNGLNEEIAKNIMEIDFSRNLSNEDYYVLKKACNCINKDIIDINNISNDIDIDVRNNIKNEFDKYKDEQIEKFRIAYYNFAKGRDEFESKFLEIYNKYKCYDLTNIKNSIHQSIKEIFLDVIKKDFYDISFNDDNQIDIDDIYNNNYEEAISLLGCDEKNFDDFIKNNQKLNSILYFGVPNNIAEQYQHYTSSIETKNDINNGKDTNETKIQDVQLTPREKNTHSNNKIMTEGSQKYYEKQFETNEQSGKKAEEIAYEKLKDKYHNIIWHSKNSKIPADKNNAPANVVCDMWNTDDNGNKTFFEIKSAINEFEMSINEYNSMKNHCDNYIVVLVDIKNNIISTHKLSDLEPLKQISKYVFAFNRIKNENGI